jgi:hypothetical protein
MSKSGKAEITLLRRPDKKVSPIELIVPDEGRARLAQAVTKASEYLLGRYAGLFDYKVSIKKPWIRPIPLPDELSRQRRGALEAHIRHCDTFSDALGMIDQGEYRASPYRIDQYLGYIMLGLHETASESDGDYVQLVGDSLDLRIIDLKDLAQHKQTRHEIDLNNGQRARVDDLQRRKQECSPADLRIQAFDTEIAQEQSRIVPVMPLSHPEAASTAVIALQPWLTQMKEAYS